MSNEASDKDMNSITEDINKEADNLINDDLDFYSRFK